MQEFTARCVCGTRVTYPTPDEIRHADGTRLEISELSAEEMRELMQQQVFDQITCPTCGLQELEIIEVKG
jgi:hypothetical protein